MHLHLANLLVCSVCSILLQCIVAGAQSEGCVSTAHGHSCALPSVPERTALIGDRLYVGITNRLLAFQLSVLELVDQVDLSPSEDRDFECEFIQGNDGPLCENFIRVIQSIPESAIAEPGQRNRILVCGTNSFYPKCRLHNPTNISTWTFMTTEEHNDDGFTPFSNARPNVGILASNGRFFSGTFFNAQTSERSIGMASRPLLGDSAFTLETPSSNPLWLNKPDFVSVYEHGDHIYFFAREPAYEVDTGRTVAYSRVIRMCKNDNGTSENQLTFLTFQKARITCRNNGERSTIPYHYDNLQATYLWVSDSGEQILYGAFSAPEFGPQGAAICKFSFSDIESVFEDGSYLVPSTEDITVFVRATPGSFSCPGTGGQSRTEQHANDFQLVFNTINAEEPEPLHVVAGEEFTQIVVDLINYDGAETEILYYSVSRGDMGVEIRQLVIVGSDSYEHTILSIPAIRSLEVHKGDAETRDLFLTTQDSVLSIELGDCSRYSDCLSCLDSKDPYCGWDDSTCVNKLLTTDPLVESYSSTGDVIFETCEQRPTTPPTEAPTPTCPHTVPTPTETDPTSGPPVTNGCTPNVGGLGTDSDANSGEPSFSIPELVGASVGGLFVGIPIGLFVCGIFFKFFVKGTNKQGSRRRAAVDLENGPGTVNSVHNQLNVPVCVQKKEQAPRNHYVDTPPIACTAEEPPEKKDLKLCESPEEDDVIAPLGSIQLNGTGPRGHRSSRSPPKPRPKPNRTRTESTRELMGSVSSEPSEGSSLDSPV